MRRSASVMHMRHCLWLTTMFILRCVFRSFSRDMHILLPDNSRYLSISIIPRNAFSVASKLSLKSLVQVYPQRYQVHYSSHRIITWNQNTLFLLFVILFSGKAKWSTVQRKNARCSSKSQMTLSNGLWGTTFFCYYLLCSNYCVVKSQKSPKTSGLLCLRFQIASIPGIE